MKLAGMLALTALGTMGLAACADTHDEYGYGYGPYYNGYYDHGYSNRAYYNYDRSRGYYDRDGFWRPASVTVYDRYYDGD